MDNSTGSNLSGVPHWEYQLPLAVAFYAVGIPLGIICVTGNVVFLVVLRLSHHDPEKAYQPLLAALVGSLGASDALGGAALAVMGGVGPNYHATYHTLYFCHLGAVFQALPILSGFLHLGVIMLERYIQICRATINLQMSHVTAVVALLWAYVLLLGFASYAFSSGRGGTATGSVPCDFLVIPASYWSTVNLAHCALGLAVCSMCQFKIRTTVKMHQRKIQVSNTMAYTKMVEDASKARPFYLVCLATVALWCPFLICQAVNFSRGQNQEAGPTVTRALFLVGHLACLKFALCLAQCSNLRGSFKKVLVKEPAKTPVRLGATSRGR